MERAGQKGSRLRIQIKNAFIFLSKAQGRSQICRYSLLFCCQQISMKCISNIPHLFLVPIHQSATPFTAVFYHSTSGDLYSRHQKPQDASRIPHYGLPASFQLALFKSKEITLLNLSHKNITNVNEVLHSLKIPKSKLLM